MEDDKYIDESWKENVASEKQDPPKEKTANQPASPEPSVQISPQNPQEDQTEYGEINFLNYISSLVFQTMIFLGEIPNPVSNQIEKNLRQAKLIIDTLTILREKTKGNLNKQEDDMLNGALYELQTHYVELFNQEGKP